MLPPRHILSKSTFVRGCQCTKSLWLYKRHYNLRDEPDTEQQRIFMQGTDVGLLARELFGNGVDASPSDVFLYRESVSDTARYIAQGHRVIFEAAFQHEGVLCAVDVLIKHKEKWYLYEVKSSTSVKPQFVQDAALQYYVITQSGLPLEDVFIVHINTGYVRCGDLQLRQLFTKQSVMQQVQAMQPEIAAKVNELRTVALQQTMPGIATGGHCIQPYRCDFFGFCHPQPGIFSEKNTQPEPVENFTKESRPAFPFCFLELFTYRVAIPGFDGHWPYRHVPFMMAAAHWTNGLQQPAIATFIANSNAEPCQQLVEQLALLNVETFPVLVADKKFVAARLTELQSDYPSLASDLDSLKNRLTEISFSNFTLPVPEGENFIKSHEAAAAAYYNLYAEKNETITERVKASLNQYASSLFEAL